MRHFAFAVAVAATLVGCSPELGTEPSVCLGQVAPTKDGCEPTRCIPEQQRYEVSQDNPKADEVFTCTACIALPPSEISTDEKPKQMTVRYVAGPLAVRMGFDNRASLDWSLDNLRKYAGTLGGDYDTYQGRMRFNAEHFEVLSFDGDKLHLRATVQLRSLTYMEQSFPPDCRLLGGMFFCNDLQCSYSDTAPGAEGVPGELVIDLNVPFVR